jgi:hypothetical protein
MAQQKHKSKYKAPKDMEKSQKIQARKDLKDYTHDDKEGAMNPKSTGEKQHMVSRKTDKTVIDDVENMVPKMTDKDRTYKKLEDGDYDPKHAAKHFKDNQKQDTKDYLEKLEDIDHGVTTKELQEKLNRLSEENKERLVREYIRRKIALMIQEQEQTDEPTTEPPATPTEPETPTEPVPAETPKADTSDIAITPEDKFVNYLKNQASGSEKAKTALNALVKSIADVDNAAEQMQHISRVLSLFLINIKNKSLRKK